MRNTAESGIQDPCMTSPQILLLIQPLACSTQPVFSVRRGKVQGRQLSRTLSQTRADHQEEFTLQLTNLSWTPATRGMLFETAVAKTLKNPYILVGGGADDAWMSKTHDVSDNVSSAKEKKVKRERRWRTCRGREGEILQSLSGVYREGLTEEGLEGAHGTSFEDLQGRSPRENKERGMWKALCIAFLKSASAMYSVHVCVFMSVCVCVCLKTFL